jgi:hypothetical protein
MAAADAARVVARVAAEAATEPAGGRKAIKKAARRRFFDIRYVFNSCLRPSGRVSGAFDVENPDFEAGRAAFKACGSRLPPAALVRGPKREIYLTQAFFTLKIIQIFNMKRPEPGKAVYFINEPLVMLLMEAEAPQA